MTKSIDTLPEAVVSYKQPDTSSITVSTFLQTDAQREEVACNGGGDDVQLCAGRAGSLTGCLECDEWNGDSLPVSADLATHTQKTVAAQPAVLAIDHQSIQ